MPAAVGEGSREGVGGGGGGNTDSSLSLGTLASFSSRLDDCPRASRRAIIIAQ